MLRKTFALILALLMTLSVTAAGYDSEENSSPALYMQTCECPDDILNYISENASKFILGIDENHELSYNLVLFLSCFPLCKRKRQFNQRLVSKECLCQIIRVCNSTR
jgi:hypothetical protein